MTDVAQVKSLELSEALLGKLYAEGLHEEEISRVLAGAIALMGMMSMEHYETVVQRSRALLGLPKET